MSHLCKHTVLLTLHSVSFQYIIYINVIAQIRNIEKFNLKLIKTSCDMMQKDTL